MSSVHSSIHSGISKASEVTTASERSTNTTSTTSDASTIQFNSTRQARQNELPGEDKMEVESEAGHSISTNLTSLSELTSTNKSINQEKME